MKLFLVGFLSIIFSGMVLSQNDSLVVSNGDVLVGEIKSMTQGVLVIETDYSDSDFNIAWENVIEFYSNRNFIVNLSEGERFYGKINSDPSAKKEIIIIEADIEHRTNLIDIVYLDAVNRFESLNNKLHTIQ